MPSGAGRVSTGVGGSAPWENARACRFRRRHAGGRHRPERHDGAAFDSRYEDQAAFRSTGFGLDGLLTVFLRIDNLADEAYDNALGFPGLPRSAAVGARFDLGGR